MNHDFIRPADHREISELIPWYVNGTIGAIARQRLDTHFLTCAACRHELLQERGTHRAMSPDSAVEYLPAASFKRLQARLDDGEIEPDRERTHRAQPLPQPLPQPLRQPLPQRWAAASIAVLAVALSLVAADTEHRPQGPELSPDYRTVTTSAPRAPNEVIRAVFAPTVMLVELQTILDEAQLRIISGPTEAGVYALAATSTRPVNFSLLLLRRHPVVRFAESTQLTEPPQRGDSP
jgi:anti-sigma factor RsiW